MDEQHAIFNNQVILEVIGKHVTLNELKLIRLISKSFLEGTLSHWRKKVAVLRVKRPYSNNLPLETGLKITNNLECDDHIYKWLDVQFTSFKFVGFEIDANFLNPKQGYMQKFWELFGPNLEYVSFQKCTLHGFKEGSILQVFHSKLPKLKHVAITGLEAVKSQHVNLCSSNPSTRHSTLRLVSFFGDEIDLWRQNEISVLHSKIKKIDLLNSGFFFQYHECTDHEEIGPSKLLDLEHLAVTIKPHLWPPYRDPFMTHSDGNIDAFLPKLADTLKILKILKVPFTRTVADPWSKFLIGTTMTKLEEIYLYGTILRDFKFLQFTPNIVKLCVDRQCFLNEKLLDEITLGVRRQFDYMRYYTFNMNLVSQTPTIHMFCNKLQHLEIDYKFSAANLRVLGEWMPSLLVLNTELDDATISTVCEIWPNLRELTCTYGSVLKNKAFVQTDGYQTIYNLRELIKFKYHAYCNKSILSDDAILKGLMLMPKLFYVELCIGNKMTTSAKAALEKVVNECKFHQRCPDATSYGMDNVCRRCKFHQDYTLTTWN